MFIATASVSCRVNKPLTPLNTSLPQWSDNNVIVPSPTVNGKWTSSISAQSFYDTIWTPAVFYAVAHSTRIVVTAQSGTDFFNAKLLPGMAQKALLNTSLSLIA
jgi:hypothetical protein